MCGVAGFINSQKELSLDLISIGVEIGQVYKNGSVQLG